jgi:hypothetical protein
VLADTDVLCGHRPRDEERQSGKGASRLGAVVRAALVFSSAGEPASASQGAARVSLDAADQAAVTRQLGRPPRGARAVAHRCPCGLPDVIAPFPTLYYLTCVRACAAASRLEAGGLMRDMNARLAADEGLREGYLTAHLAYATRRAATAAAAGVPPLPPDAPTAGGMPDRVKCLHALVAHERAVPGSNPLGREAIAAMGEWWAAGPCVEVPGTP